MLVKKQRTTTMDGIKAVIEILADKKYFLQNTEFTETFHSQFYINKSHSD